jgi:glycosyltransferase 2 family protein
LSRSVPEPGGGRKASGSRLPLKFGEYALKALASAAMLGLLVSRLDLRQLTGHLAAIDLRLVAAAVLLLALVPITSLLRWRAILECLGYSLPVRKLIGALYISLFFNQVLPTSIGGDAWRVWFCTRQAVPVGVAAKSVLIERAVGLLTILGLFVVAFPQLLLRVGDDPLRWALWFVLACVAVPAVLLFSAARLSAIPGLRLVALPIAQLSTVLFRLARSPRMALLQLATSAVGYFLTALAYFLLGQSIGIPLSLGDCIMTLPPILLIALAPISLGGWGLREGAAVAILRFYGIVGEQALLLSLLLGLAMLASSMPGLALWLGRSRPVISRNPPGPDPASRPA